MINLFFNGIRTSRKYRCIFHFLVTFLSANLELSYETEVKPKPMVEIGGHPILWHIMMHYAHHGFKNFVIALGYKGEMIKKYMVDYCSLHSNLTVHLGTGKVQIHNRYRGKFGKLNGIKKSE